MPDLVAQEPPLADYVTAWLQTIDLTLGELRARDNRPVRVAIRRQVAVYLREHGWTLTRIGRFIGRDHSSVTNLLKAARRRGEYAAPAGVVTHAAGRPTSLAHLPTGRHQFLGGRR